MEYVTRFVNKNRDKGTCEQMLYSLGPEVLDLTQVNLFFGNQQYLGLHVTSSRSKI